MPPGLPWRLFFCRGPLSWAGRRAASQRLSAAHAATIASRPGSQDRRHTAGSRDPIRGSRDQGSKSPDLHEVSQGHSRYSRQGDSRKKSTIFDNYSR